MEIESEYVGEYFPGMEPNDYYEDSTAEEFDEDYDNGDMEENGKNTEGNDECEVQ